MGTRRSTRRGVPRLSTWLSAWRNRDDREAGEGVLELLVVAGADAGDRFTLEGDRVLIGRGESETGRIDVIRLRDRSISRRQAWIRREQGRSTLEHVDDASNPTRVNGVAIDRVVLGVGDRIEIGRVVLEVHARAGLGLSAPAVPIAAQTGHAVADAAAPRAQIDAEATELRPMKVRVAELVLVRGPEGQQGRCFPITLGATRIGRSEDAEVRIAEAGVSRLHAELVVEGAGLVLRPLSTTNPNIVNGFSILDQTVLADGDVIELADRVALRISLLGAGRESRPDASPARSSGLVDGLARKLDLERSIESVRVSATFLDVDVVESRVMKAPGAKAEHIVVSFERFREFVAGLCREHGGRVLNSNGDELMCFFESADAAVSAGCAILERLPEFNRELNLLPQPFRFRLGAHSGVSLVDLEAGIAYSEVLDLAGHIQKRAEPDSLLISQATRDALPEAFEATAVPDPLAEAGVLYRVEGRSRRAAREGADATQVVS